MGFWASLLGGRPGLINGADGPLVVIMKDLVQEFDEREGPGQGLEYLLAATILMGIFQMLLAFVAVGRFLRLVPRSVIIGFLDGVAVVIGLAQTSNFKDNNGKFIEGEELGNFLIIVVVTMITVAIAPKITKFIPAAFLGIVVGTGLEKLAGFGTRTIEDIIPISGEFPTPRWPNVPFNAATFSAIVGPAFNYAAIGKHHKLAT